jgi:antitoxin (DNA-binding transcriptional repressor) of toxin-antitoxin stability system
VSFVICRNGAPVADLVPHKIKNRIKPHPALSKIKLKYNPIESASEEEWPKNIR